MPRTTIALLVAAALALPAVAQPPAPTVETTLGRRRPITVALDAATVTVTIDPRATTWLQAIPENPAASPADAALDIRWDQGPIVIRRAAAAAAEPERRRKPLERLQLDLVVLPSQPLRIEGADLDLRVTTADDLRAQARAEAEREAEREAEEKARAGEGVAEDEAADDGADDDDGQDGGAPPRLPRSATAPSWPPAAAGEDGEEALPYDLAIGVEGSRVDLAGVRSTLLVATASVVRIERTNGELAVAAHEASEVEILDHRGTLNIDAADSDLAVVDGSGKVQLQLAGSNVILRDGSGAVTGDVAAGLLIVDRWRGHTKLTGANAPLEIHGSDATHLLEVSGQRLDVTIRDWRGNVTVKLRGGRLVGSDWRGAMSVEAEAAGEVELERLGGPLELVLRPETRARVREHQGRLNAELVGASLDAHQLWGIDLKAQDGTVTLGALERLLAFQAAGTEIDLDLTDLRGVVALTLRRAASGSIRLTAPCNVWVEGPASSGLGDQVDVVGCDLQLANRRHSFGARMFGGTPPTYLKLNLGEEARIRVEGNP